MKYNQTYTKLLALLAAITFAMLSVPASAQAIIGTIAVNPTVVAGGQPATGTVTLAETSTSATTVILGSSSAVVKVPPSVVVPAGQTSCTFAITTTTVTTTATFSVFGSTAKIERSASLTVAVDGLKSLTCTPVYNTGGFPTTYTVTLYAPAPTGGWTVTLYCNTTTAEPPNTITIPAGHSSGTFLSYFGSLAEYCESLILAKDSVGTTASVTQAIHPLFFYNFDGAQGSPTTINGISNNNVPVGFTTHNGVNYNFIFNNLSTYISVNMGDPAAGSLNALNVGFEGVGVANGFAVKIVGGSVETIPIANATSSVAFGLNDSGIIVGQYTLSNNTTPGFVDVAGTITTLIPKPGATVVNVQGVNNHNIICGFYSFNGVNQFPFLYNIATKAYTFPAVPSTARTKAGGLVLTQFLGINDAGIVCGYYQTNNGSQFGLIYNTNNFTYTYVDDPVAAPVGGVQITQLVGISNNTIAGFFIDAEGNMHGFFAQ